MQKPHRIERPTTRNVGDPCSKYGYDRNGSQFAADIAAAEKRYTENWEAFVEFMQSRDVDPRAFRNMFTRYYEEFLKEVNL